MDSYQPIIAPILIVFGYVLGSVPAAYMIARARGVNILEVGTGNPGTANVFRSVSRPMGAVVLLADALKGFIPVVTADMVGAADVLLLVVGASAVVGHWYPAFLRFKGGAGLATAVGAGIGLILLPGAIGLAWGALIALSLRNTVYGAVIGYAGFMIVSRVFGVDWVTIFAAMSLAAIVMLRTIIIDGLWRRDKG